MAGEIEEPFGDNRGFIESRDQKRVCVVRYKKQSSNLFPTNEQESSPRMQMDRGEVVVEEAADFPAAACQVGREAREPHAVDCVRVYLDAWCLSEVLFKGDSESATQVLVDEMEVERGEEAVVEESPKCLYQSGSEAEDTVQRTESLTQTCARVLREELGRTVVSKSIASPRPDRQVVPSQSEKRDDGHGWSVGTGVFGNGRAGVAMGHESLPGSHGREGRGRRGCNSWS